MKRYVAFPSSFSRIPLLTLDTLLLDEDWGFILSGPTPSGLYLLRVDDKTIQTLRSIYDGLYLFMDDDF